MLSRRGFLAASIAVGEASRVRAQTGDAAPTVLRLERRDIEVNGKSASVFCIRQPDGTFEITTDVGKPFRVRMAAKTRASRKLSSCSPTSASPCRIPCAAPVAPNP